MMSSESRYREVFKFFMRLGLTGFGGPLALIAEMQKELVEKRHWISMDEFRQALAMIKAMPGPVAYQTAVFMGFRRSNRLGGLLAGFCIMFPAFVMMVLLALSYSFFRQSEHIIAIFDGFQMGALVLIALAVKPLTSGYLKRARFWGLGLISFIFLLAGSIPEPVLILAAGAWSVFFDQQSSATFSGSGKKTFELGSTLLLIGWFCFKSGAIVFGTGLAMIPFLEADFVNSGLITKEQFMDAVAFAQLTPGPVSVSVTFMGFQIAGILGAVVTSVAVFLPATIHQLTWFPGALRWMSAQKWIQSFLLGAMATITAGVLLAIFKLGSGSTAVQFVVFFLFLGLALRLKLPSWAVVVGGGIVSWVLHLVGSI